MKTVTQTAAGFEARYQGTLIATEPTEAAAREKLNEYAYDLARGRVADEPLGLARAADRQVEVEGSVPHPFEELLAALVAEQERRAASGLTVTHNRDLTDPRDDGYLLYALGVAELAIEGGGANVFVDNHEAVTFFPNAGPNEFTPQQALDAVRDLARLLSHPTVQRALGLSSPEVRLERYVSAPDSVGGKVYTGWSFKAGGAEIFISDEHARYHRPSLHGFKVSMDIEEIDRLMPGLTALFSDPRVAEARRRWAAGLPFETPPC